MVNNAGIFLTKPFTDFTAQDFDTLVSTNLLGFFYITQRTVKEMLKQKSGCVVSITAALADRPIAGVNGSVSMITKGGLNSATKNLAIEYAKDGIRFNAVAPGVVDTEMHRNANESTLQPAMKKATVEEVVDAVLYLAQAGQCERRDTPRGWCRSGSSLAGAIQFNVVSARVPASYLRGDRANTRPKMSIGSNSGRGRHDIEMRESAMQCLTAALE